MAVNYTTPVTVNGPNLVPILEEIFFMNHTIEHNYVTFNDNIKAGTIITEESISVGAQLYTGAALASSGNIYLADRAVVLTKLEYKQTYLDEAVRTSRLSLTMKKGAWNIESSEFNEKVLMKYGPKVSYDAELQFWGGVTSTTKTAVAALVPGAGQGSITAAAQTAFAALTAGPVDGIFSKAFYDNGAIGQYIKVTGTTVTATNIADEVQKIFTAILPEMFEDPNDQPVIYCPRAWKQLVYNANNTKGAAQEHNFLIKGEEFGMSRVWYNGVEMLFVPVPNNLWAYCHKKSRVMWNTDMVDDVNKVEFGKTQNDGDTKFMRSIYCIHTHIGNANKGILYGG